MVKGPVYSQAEWIFKKDTLRHKTVKFQGTKDKKNILKTSRQG